MNNLQYEFKFPVVEIVDRYCIAKLKFLKLKNNKEELDFYEKQMQNLDTESITNELKDLYDVHCKVWELEDDFKRYRIENMYSLEEIGKRALKIRDLMENRYILKNLIAKKLNDSIQERKNYGNVFIL